MSNESETKLTATADVEEIEKYRTSVEQLTKSMEELKAVAASVGVSIPGSAASTGAADPVRRGRSPHASAAQAPPPVPIIRYHIPSSNAAGVALTAPRSARPARFEGEEEEDWDLPWAYEVPEMPTSIQRRKDAAAARPRIVMQPPPPTPIEVAFVPRIVRHTPESTATEETVARAPAAPGPRGSYMPPLMPTRERGFKYVPEDKEDDEDEEEDTHQPGPRVTGRSRSRRRSAVHAAVYAGAAPVAGAVHYAVDKLFKPFELVADFARYTRDTGSFRRGWGETRAAHSYDPEAGPGPGRDTFNRLWKGAKEQARDAFGKKEEEEGDEDGPSKEDKRHGEVLKELKRFSQTAQSSVKQVAYGAVGYGIGSSIMGFFSQASGEYIQHAAAVRQMKQAYREFGSEARGIGYQIGYTVQETVRLTQAIGQQTNSVSRGRFHQYAGFARQYGVDDTQVASTVGAVNRMQGGAMRASAAQLSAGRHAFGMSASQANAQESDLALLGLHAHASSLGMGKGRFGEYLQTYEQAATAQFSATGEVNAGTDYAMRFGGMVFGPKDERSKGQTGLEFSHNVGKMVSGDSSQAMRVFMLRALNYGKAGGASYIETQKQLEAGITDPRNAAAFFSRMRAKTAGMTSEDQKMQMYMMLERDGKSSGLNAAGLEKLIDFGRSDAGMRTLEGFAKDPEAAKFAKFDAEQGKFLDSRALAKGGFGAVGKGLTTTAEVRNVQLEAMRSRVGEKVTGIMVTLGSTMEHLGNTIGNVIKGFTGEGLLDSVQRLAKSAESASVSLDSVSESAAGQWAKHGVKGTLKRAWDQVGSNDMTYAEAMQASARGHRYGGTTRTPLNPAKHTAGAGGGKK